MKTYESQMIEESVLISVTCDVCNKTFKANDLEIQEFISIDFVGGYNSIFGDGTKVKGDICQHCLNLYLGPYLKKTES